MINFLRIIGNIRLGDYLHKDGTINDTPTPDILGVCVIPSDFLPDKYARFISLTQKASYHQWGRDIKLKSEFKRRLPGKRKEDGVLRSGYFIEKGYRFRNGDALLESPYLLDDSFNPEFLRDIPFGNAFQDYRGYENMRIYKEKYSNDGTLSNVFTEIMKESPSYGKNDWYLPSIGELAFIPPKVNLIRDKINRALISGSPGVILPADYFWSSSEKDPDDVWEVNTSHCGIDSSYKIIGGCVRAFLIL